MEIIIWVDTIGIDIQIQTHIILSLQVLKQVFTYIIALAAQYAVHQLRGRVAQSLSGDRPKWLASRNCPLFNKKMDSCQKRSQWGVALWLTFRNHTSKMDAKIQGFKMGISMSQ